MLYIKQKEINSLLVRESTWHVGQPLPHISRPVVTFQADGDELRVILKALHEHSKQPPAMPVVESPGD